jgi:hypothetical protein
MSKLREKAEAQTEQVIGHMLGDEQLVKEGQKRLRDTESEPPDDDANGADQGIVRDERGQEQPKDKERAQQVSRIDKGAGQVQVGFVLQRAEKEPFQGAS